MTIEKTPDAVDPQRELISAVRSINRSARHEVSIPGDDEPCYWQRREWVLWLLEMADAAEQALNERKPDGVAVTPGIPADLQKIIDELSVEAQVRVVMDDPLGKLLAKAGMALIGMRKALTTPIPMILHCPECRAQHIDEPEEHDALKRFTEQPTSWENPPHRSHFCHACGCIWRPADVLTVGVKAIGTRGKADTFPARARSDEPKADVA